MEVQPILDVLLNKSVEQACLEVEEEHEMEQIKQFKEGYHKRRIAEESEWQQEVKKEIALIKNKNKTLETARDKRKQQFETIQKLQCLNLAKSFLKNNFVTSVKLLAEKKHWKDTFKDQLHCEYKDWLYSAVARNLTNKQKAKVEQDDICKNQFVAIGQEKVPIKRRVAYKLDQKERGRLIESKDKRLVHFLFNSGQKSKMSPFARDMFHFIENANSLEAVTSR